MKEIYFVGSINRGGEMQGGETIKNQIFVDFLKTKFNLQITDTFNWQRKLIALFAKCCKILLTSNKNPIVLSTSPRGAHLFLWLSNILNYKRKKIYYFAVGGVLAERIKSGVLNKKIFEKISYFFVETNDLSSQLSDLGFSNVKIIPNFKNYSYTPKLKPHGQMSDLQCYFLSRIIDTKGCNIIINAIKLLKQKGVTVKVDFYGSIEESYKTEFLTSINNSTLLTYKGFLYLSDERNYEVLSAYDLFLFPTFYAGEGFPGAIIDSFIAGVPSIVSNWKYNSEIVTENKTGFIVESKNVESLAQKLEFCAKHSNNVRDMRKHCINEAKKFHVNFVLNNINRLLQL